MRSARIKKAMMLTEDFKIIFTSLAVFVEAVKEHAEEEISKDLLNFTLGKPELLRHLLLGDAHDTWINFVDLVYAFPDQADEIILCGLRNIDWIAPQHSGNLIEHFMDALETYKLAFIKAVLSDLLVFTTVLRNLDDYASLDLYFPVEKHLVKNFLFENEEILTHLLNSHANFLRFKRIFPEFSEQPSMQAMIDTVKGRQGLRLFDQPASQVKRKGSFSEVEGHKRPRAG